MSENKKSDGAFGAGLVMVLGFIGLIIAAVMSDSHPLDFMVNFFATLTGYIFLIAFIGVLIGFVVYQFKIASDDPEKSLSEATKENLEYSKEVTSDIATKAKKFYASYKERVEEAKSEQKED